MVKGIDATGLAIDFLQDRLILGHQLLAGVLTWIVLPMILNILMQSSTQCNIVELGPTTDGKDSFLAARASSIKANSKDHVLRGSHRYQWRFLLHKTWARHFDHQ